MSLRVWLPLTKDLRQQGLDNVTVTNNGATFNSAGKLGGCYSFDGVDDRISCSSNTWTYPMSISAWFKPTDVTNTNTQYWLSYNTASGGTAGHAIGIGLYGAKLSIWYGGQVRSLSTVITNNVWYHIAVTIDANKKVITYLNGTQIDTVTFTSNNPGSAWLTLGARSNSSTGGIGGALYFYKGYMNDARLYDHCLSPMEVKELAKGLVLHYPLNRQGWGQENLFTEKYWSYGSGWNVKNLINSNVSTTKPIINSDGSCTLTGGGDTTNSQCYCANSGNMVSLESNTTYTISVKITTNGPCNFRMWWYDYDNNGTHLNTYSTNSEIIPSGTTKIFSVTHTTVANTAKCYWELNLYSTSSTSTCLMHAKSLKLEKGFIVTPWCPNSSDTLATTMGLNSTTEYDCSGFCNNGTRTGTFTWTSDTPKYSVSQYFNGSSYILTNSGTFSWFNFDKCTVAVWMKPTTTPSSWAGTFGIAHNNSSSNKSFVVGNYGGKFTMQSANGNWVNVQTSNLPINEWHHCVATLDGTTIKMYFDGELVNTYTINWGNTTVASDTRVQVGNDLPGSDEIYVGYYSDARIYATALSADDVKSLYQNSAYIDSSGNVYGAVHSEV